MFQFAIDRGGTFTDVWARCPNGKTRVLKLLSDDPSNYTDAPREGIRRILQDELHTTFPPQEPIDASCIDWIRMGTTVATNALLERKGQPMALIVTKGFKDLLHIGNQSRPNIFDLAVEMPNNLYEAVIEAEERVWLCKDNCEIGMGGDTRTGNTAEKVQVRQMLNSAKLEEDLKNIYRNGIRSLAVALMHSYTFNDHEKQISELAKKIGFTHISLSHEVMPMVKVVNRGYTACVDAYLTPCIKRYVEGFISGFTNLDSGRVLFMKSDGGLIPMTQFIGSRAILSGPAGGVVGYAVTSTKFLQSQPIPVIGFDMGGTSTDVSRFAGSYEHVFESTAAGVTIQSPQLDINTVAAGGGSQLFFRSGMFVVGPESAGAHPGPVCYKKGGPLTVTDANLILNRLLPAYFPKIFGPEENEALDYQKSYEAFQLLTNKVNEYNTINGKPVVPVEEVAIGFIKVANEAMCRPIRALTEAKGYDTANHALACFGGAGGQHACSVAKALGIKTVYIHKYAGILSAYGMALADVVYEEQEPAAVVYHQSNFPYIEERLHILGKQATEQLLKQGFSLSNIDIQMFLHLRYEGTDCALMSKAQPEQMKNEDSCKYGDFKLSFVERYRREFGFELSGRNIIVDDIRIRGIGKSRVADEEEQQAFEEAPQAIEMVKVFFDQGKFDTGVFLLKYLKPGQKVAGPAILIEKNNTVVVEPGCEATMTKFGDLCLTVKQLREQISEEIDPIHLSIFSHRFMSIAEQMGRVLQRTSISTNIKERLDFSCALFGPDGGLVANAPHIPVHLGAMQETVQYQLRQLDQNLKPGDVLLANHPCAGGSHLPDLTVITPVFDRQCESPVFFVACRGHHADIGGITPGSMPPHSKSIIEEGAVFKSFFLVMNNCFQEDAVRVALMKPAEYPGCTGTRNMADNLSDLKAQVAANQKGIVLVQQLIAEYGLSVVKAYMKHIQENAELAVREMLKEIAAKRNTGQLFAEQFMDDGSKIALSVSIDEISGDAVFDFSGTDCEVIGNCNAPRAVTLSAVIYCLRCMVGHDVPLNQGCLKPVQIIITKGSLLDPSDMAAVVGGNVLTSQRIVDTVFAAFGVCAASQGCMNNITFGDDTMAYYETVAGGAGAGPTWHGRSGVHSHMTNTRITDPEILERRYPVILKEFTLHTGSGGDGQFRGGDGVCRRLLFRKKLMLSVLTERRVFHPYGLNGGKCGERGRNILIKGTGRRVNLGGKCSVAVDPGDVFELITPGGGGYGPPCEKEFANTINIEYKKAVLQPTGSVFDYKRLQESA